MWTGGGPDAACRVGANEDRKQVNNRMIDDCVHIKSITPQLLKEKKCKKYEFSKWN